MALMASAKIVMTCQDFSVTTIFIQMSTITIVSFLKLLHTSTTSAIIAHDCTKNCNMPSHDKGWKNDDWWSRQWWTSKFFESINMTSTISYILNVLSLYDNLSFFRRKNKVFLKLCKRRLFTDLTLSFLRKSDFSSFFNHFINH